jgi:membrane fusion protein (multidrug efflux system)
MYKLSLAFLIIIGLFACKAEDKKPVGDKPAGGGNQKPMMVEGIIAKDEITSGSINTTGTIMANEEVEVKSEISGKIEGIFFKEGSLVNKGQLLVKLDDDDLQAQINKLKIEIKLAEEKEARQKQLLAAAAISKEEYDISQANVNLLKANEFIIKTNIEKTRVTAPFSGIIGLKNVSPGAIITPATSIATIQNVQPLKLEFSVPEKYNNLVTLGKVVEFKVAGMNQTLKAAVYAKEPKIDASTRTTRVRASFANPGGKIFPGSFAEILILVGEKTKVIMVPTIAYIPDINGAKMFVCKDGMAVNVTVKAGLRTENEIQIVEGLSTGDTVLTSGILQLKPKTPVEVNIIQRTP